jgi:DNA modification methylase
MHNDPRRLQFGGQAKPPDRLVLGDCLDVFRRLSPSCVDLVYIDPPFGTGKARRGRGGEQARYADDLSDPEVFTAWLWPRLAAMRDALAPHGSLFLHLDYRAVHYAKVALDRLFGRDRFVNEIIWCYSVGGKSRRSFGRKHDTILWYGKSREYAFFPDEVRVPRKQGSHMRVVRGDDGVAYQEKTHRKTGKIYRYPVHAGKIPEDWWTDIETLNRGDRERTGWPTQKPERLLERLVRATSAPGGRVADGFCGSGTTAIVAQRLGRQFLASDTEPKAIACAVERIRARGEELAATGSPPPDVIVELCSVKAGRQLPLPEVNSHQPLDS